MLLLISCYLADLIFGDPEWFPHPVRGVGKLIGLLDRRFCGGNTPRVERIKGVIVTLTVVGISAYLAYLLIVFSRKLNPFCGGLAGVYLGYAVLAGKDLRVKAKAVWREAEKGALVKARRELAKIVGRDTDDLSTERVVAATIESIAESTNDGIVAPLFYLTLGGPILAVAYKAVNTLDSMIGYKNERYLNFGRLSARLDDMANFIPARITGCLIAAASFLLGKGCGRSFKIMRRDGSKHSSPNSGISEAAMAGALRIRLGGPLSYQGKHSAKPYLGEEDRRVEAGLIKEALRISLVVSLLMVLIGVFFLKWIR